MGERYPDRIPPALAEVLGMPPMNLHPWWMALREVGVEVPKRYEGEVASALHFLIPFALSAPDRWQAAAAEELIRLRDGGTFVPAAFQLAPASSPDEPAPDPAADRKHGLTVDVVGGRLVIAIGVETVMAAVTAADFWDEDELRVTDADAFAEEIAHALRDEQEDGTTPVHLMIDGAAETAVENGCDGITFPGEANWNAQ